MWPIYKRELGSYYKGFVGYLVALPLLILAGIYTWVYNLLQAYPGFEPVVYGLRIVLVFVVPVLTMRVMAEERHRHTDQLLYSLPTTMTRVVLGKYLAMVTVFAVPVAVIAFYPLLLSAFGPVPLDMACGNLLAFFLLGCALIAGGQFLSSTTENQAVALTLTLLALLVNFFLTGIASYVSDSAAASLTALVILFLLLGVVTWLLTRNVLVSGGLAGLLIVGASAAYLADASRFTGLFRRTMEAVSLFARTDAFASGIFDLTAVVYYLAVTGVFLFLTVQSMEKRRWS